MRLRPSPAVEAMGTVAVAFLIVLAWHMVFPPLGGDILTTASVISALFLFPMFTFQLVIGFFVRAWGKVERFAIAVGIGLVLGVVFYILGLRQAPYAAIIYNGALLLSLLANVVGLALTIFLIVDDNKVNLSKSQYVVNPVVPSKSKRKKKK